MSAEQGRKILEKSEILLATLPKYTVYCLEEESVTYYDTQVSARYINQSSIRVTNLNIFAAHLLSR